jgi:two-component system, NtrC family, sensor kinase
MARRSTGGNASKASKPKAPAISTTKRRVAPAATLRQHLPVFDLIKELNEAREQQTATSEVLKIINASAGDLTPVFDAMLEKAMRLSEASFGGLAVPDGEFARLVAIRGITGPYAELITSKPYRRSALFGSTLETPSVIHILDLKDGESYRRRAPTVVEAVELGGIRTWLLVPLLKDNKLLGGFLFYRREPSQTNTSRCCKISPIKPSLQWKTRACSTSFGNEQMSLPDCLKPRKRALWNLQGR